MENLREISFDEYLDAHYGRMSFGFDQCLEIENLQMNTQQMMEVEQSGYYNTIKHFFKYCREKIKNKGKSKEKKKKKNQISNILI